MVLGSFYRDRLAFLGESVLELRVSPSDLDVYGHMNNGRYLTLMDLGRMDLIMRTGLGKVTRKRGWKPLVGSVRIRYRRSLKLFNSFNLHTKIASWNEKWFVIEQRFERHGQTVAQAWVKGLFFGPKGKVPTRELLTTMGVDGLPAALPSSLQNWLENDRF